MNLNRKVRISGLIITITILVSGFTVLQQKSPGLHLITVKSSKDLHSIFKYNGQRARFVSAHRGGALPGFPENCIETFENTLKHTFAILEIDPWYTTDSAMVLHHDPTLSRTTNGEGHITEYSLSELRRLKLKDMNGKLTDYHMPTLDEALEWAKGKTILVLDQKNVSARDRLKKVEEHNAIANAVLIVYSFEDAKLCYSLNKDVMMEVMIPNAEKVHEFDKTGVPWSNVVAFVGHNVPEDPVLYKMIHDRGAMCMAGSSRNVDKEFLAGQSNDISRFSNQYLRFFEQGIDIIETDIPVYLGPLVNPAMPSKSLARKFFRISK